MGNITPLIAALADLEGPADAPRAGHKAASLAALVAAGFPVPEGVCVLTPAFALALEPHRQALEAALAGLDLTDPAGAQAAAGAATTILGGLTLPAPVATALHEACDQLPAGPVAVRSSGLAEDRADASFAGAYATVLGPSTVEAIAAAICTCWRSAFGPEALLGRARLGLGALPDPDGRGGMAVLVQTLIDAEVAGVAYSADPVAQTAQTLVVNAVWGLGTGAVDGSVPVDTAWVARDDLETRRRQIVVKDARQALGADGAMARVPVAPERQRTACLPPAWLHRIGEFVLAAEQVLGGPQDMEWAIAGQRIFVLQSRPVTALAAKAQIEPWQGETQSPDLRQPAWRRLRERPEEPLAQDIGEAGRLAHTDSPFTDVRDEADEIRLFRGIPYRRTIPPRHGAGDRRIRQAACEARGAWLRDLGITPWAALQPEVAAATARLAAFDYAAATAPALAEQLEDAFGAYRYHWALHWEMVALNRAFGAPFRAAFETVCGLEGEASWPLRGEIVAGEDSELTRLIDALYALGQEAGQHEAVAALLRAGSPDLLPALRSLDEAGPLLASLETLLTEHGDRCGAGFGSSTSVRTPTWREDPSLPLRLLVPYLDPRAPAPSALRAAAWARRDQRVAELVAACADEAAKATFERLLPLARAAAANLENHNHYIDQRAVGQLRTAILAAGRALAARGSIPTGDDVFWLHRAEITSALVAEVPLDLGAVVRERRAAHEAAKTAPVPPAVLGTPDAALPARPDSADEVTPEADVPAAAEAAADPLLRGQAASPGRHTGRARVVDGSTLCPEISPGDVLVAGDAGPLWTPFFPVLGALVLDRGAMLQHAASTAREYGIPAVVQTKEASRRIPDGALVTVDGLAGTVAWVVPGDPSA